MGEKESVVVFRRIAYQEDDGTISKGTIAHYDPDVWKPWWLPPIPKLTIKWDDGEEDTYFGNDALDMLKFEETNE